MKQAIAGVAPAEAEEVTIMTVWPSISAFSLGRVLGRLYSINVGVFVFTVGNLIALLSIPGALKLYFFRLFPSVLGIGPHGCFYRLTNRGVQQLRNEVYLALGKHAGSRTAQLCRLIGSALLAVGVLAAWFLIYLFISPLTNSFFVPLIAGVLVFLGAVGVAKLLWTHLKFGVVIKSIEFTRFDRIETEVQSGQEWFKAGDLIFYLGDSETFRLVGVSRPEAFRQTCLKARNGYAGTQEALEREAAMAS